LKLQVGITGPLANGLHTKWCHLVNAFETQLTDFTEFLWPFYWLPRTKKTTVEFYLYPTVSTA